MKFRVMVTNLLYFTVVFIVAVLIATQGISRKVNTYKATEQPIFFSVEKERISIANSVTGRVDLVMVATGDHVNKGDLLVKLVDDSLSQKILSLTELAEENISARTELELLKARASEYEIRAPRDGVVYQLHTAEGSYLTMNAPVLTLFADNNVKLVGELDQEQYVDIQKAKDIEVFSSRFEQVYKISFEGVGRVKSGIAPDDAKYEVRFKFFDADEGAAFIDGEALEVVSTTSADHGLRPSERVAKIWNSLILGR
ncbi:MAG: HlyD family secretion protein [Candidatus Moraniibacteriota bacterium]|nr:MAG: HlyD family secretion protein [Candidatus Moranbacteria bacterium]